MANIINTDDRMTRWMRRIARIWSSPIIVYSLIMLYGYAWNLMTIGKADPYTVEGYPLVEAIPPILMFLSVLGLCIAWRWERLGGAITLVFQFAALWLLQIQRPINHDSYRSAVPYLMSMVIIIPGIFFMVCGRRSRNVPTL